jgi:Icc-related predicted phosphoesterase
MELGGARITVCPWWDGPKGRARVDELLTAEAALAAGAERWIWIYHWPPPELPVSWTGRQSYGDADLAGWIERFAPALVLTGHVHQAPLADGGSWLSRTGDTWVINGGHQIGEVPSHVVVDLDAWSASWWSIEATDDRSLVVPQPA